MQSVLSDLISRFTAEGALYFSTEATETKQQLHRLRLQTSRFRRGDRLSFKVTNIFF